MAVISSVQALLKVPKECKAFQDAYSSDAEAHNSKKATAISM